jgi:hypothetical protein
VQQRFPIGRNSPCRSRCWLILRMRMRRKQLHTPDHVARLVIEEPILTRLEAGNDRMPCCRGMLGRMLARGTVAATDVPTAGTPTEMKPPPFGDPRHSTHPSPLGFEAGLIPRRSFFIYDSPFGLVLRKIMSSHHHGRGRDMFCSRCPFLSFVFVVFAPRIPS